MVMLPLKHCYLDWKLKINEKPREWHNHKPQPTHDTKRKKKDRASWKHLRVIMTSPFLYLYSKKQDWSDIVKKMNNACTYEFQ